MDIYMDIEVAVRTLPQESRLFKYKKKIRKLGDDNHGTFFLLIVDY